MTWNWDWNPSWGKTSRGRRRLPSLTSHRHAPGNTWAVGDGTPSPLIKARNMEEDGEPGSSTIYPTPTSSPRLAPPTPSTRDSGPDPVVSTSQRRGGPCALPCVLRLGSL